MTRTLSAQAHPEMSTSSKQTTPAAKASGGLEGVVAAHSEICFIDGVGGRLVYRGYDIADLLENSTFEETAFLLWDGRLPNRAELSTLRSQLSAAESLPRHAMAVLQALPPKTQPMDALRTTVSALASVDPDIADNSP